MNKSRLIASWVIAKISKKKMQRDKIVYLDLSISLVHFHNFHVSLSLTRYTSKQIIAWSETWSELELSRAKDETHLSQWANLKSKDVGIRFNNILWVWRLLHYIETSSIIAWILFFYFKLSPRVISLNFLWKVIFLKVP